MSLQARLAWRGHENLRWGKNLRFWQVMYFTHREFTIVSKSVLHYSLKILLAWPPSGVWCAVMFFMSWFCMYLGSRGSTLRLFERYSIRVGHPHYIFTLLLWTTRHFSIFCILSLYIFQLITFAELRSAGWSVKILIIPVTKIRTFPMQVN